MDGQLTYEALCAARHDLNARFRAYIPLLTYRAQWEPEFVDTSAEVAHSYPQFIVLLSVYLIETIQHPWYLRSQTRYIHLTYGITATGRVSYITAPQMTWNGAERVYQQPVEQWVEAVLLPLQEAASKRRIQTRARLFHEDLVAAVWAPARVAKRLEGGGWEAIEAL